MKDTGVKLREKRNVCCLLLLITSGNLINKTYFDWLLFTGYSIISKGAY